jgi:orotidine-5'-phosphate decarboxylase
MTHREICALMRGIAPIVSDYVRAEIGKANARFAEEIAQLRAELTDLRAKVGFDARITALEAKVEQSRSGVRRVA